MRSHAVSSEACAMKTAIVILLIAAWVAGLVLVLPAGS